MWTKRKSLIVTKPTVIYFFDLKKEKTQIDHVKMEQLIMECIKALLYDSEHYDEYSDSESK